MALHDAWPGHRSAREKDSQQLRLLLLHWKAGKCLYQDTGNPTISSTQNTTLVLVKQTC